MYVGNIKILNLNTQNFPIFQKNVLFKPNPNLKFQPKADHSTLNSFPQINSTPISNPKFPPLPIRLFKSFLFTLLTPTIFHINPMGSIDLVYASRDFHKNPRFQKQSSFQDIIHNHKSRPQLQFRSKASFHELKPNFHTIPKNFHLDKEKLYEQNLNIKQE